MCQVRNYEVYPSVPLKVWAAPPAEKGVLTEEQLMAEYILPTTVTNPLGEPIPGFTFFTESLRSMFTQALLNPRPDQMLAGGYGAELPASCPEAEAVNAATKQFLQELEAISENVQVVSGSSWVCGNANKADCCKLWSWLINELRNGIWILP